MSVAEIPAGVPHATIGGLWPTVGAHAGTWSRHFTVEGVHPFDSVRWKTVDARIVGGDGSVKFEQLGIEVPEWWTENSSNIVADKYFRMINGVRENSVKQIFTRVAQSLRAWATRQNFFETEKDAEIYEHELLHCLIHQLGAFNSPVWFNLGVPGRAQTVSACFISGVEDSLEDIMRYQTAELTIFRSGSGSGANLSAIRSSYERLSSGAYVCGPIGWMEGLDKNAKSMKSGGTTRNAAKMVVLNMDHPDIMETKDGRPGFIPCKSVEEKRAHALIEAGYPSGYDDPNSAYKNVNFQNANHSVSVPDSFMRAVEQDAEWTTFARTTGKPVGTYRARDVWKKVAESAWICGDPGVQFSDSINSWHTTPAYGRINASNPCSEFLCSDNTACNLCALNLLKFWDGKSFDYVSFGHAVRVFSTAQMAIVDMAEYPTEEIAKNSRNIRPIGTNYGNLGALLMRMGLPYDSDEGRAVAARLASHMTGTVYKTGAQLAARLGAFPAYANDRDNMLAVMARHQVEDDRIGKSPAGGKDATRQLWADVLRLGGEHGFYNSQATVQAPLGTISYLMGMDTTGIEPTFSLVSYKSLVGGGSMKMVNRSVRPSLEALGYSAADVDAICAHVEALSTVEGAPGFRPEHAPVFDAASAAGPSGRCLSPMGHLKMMAAIQPLITCAQSKTVNLPNSATVEDIMDIYTACWKLGIKCVALYRDGCKMSQPLSTKKEESSSLAQAPIERGIRNVMPKDVTGSRHKFDIAGHKGYITMNNYPDGTLGEVFMKLGRSGSTMSGLLNSFTQLLSISLQYGVPVEKIVGSFAHTKFEPAGMTDNPQIRFADSLIDYLAKLLDQRYSSGELTGGSRFSLEKGDSVPPAAPSSGRQTTTDAPPCTNCGGITFRNGSCHLCQTCGTSSGCS
jgi:ribonucleoside-diphosphate reductase alpha chain